MVKRKLEKILTSVALATSIATGAQAQSANLSLDDTQPTGQQFIEPEQTEETPTHLIKYNALYDTEGLHSQTSWTMNINETTRSLLLAETIPGGSNIGYDLKDENKFRLNLGYGQRDSSEDLFRILGQINFEKGFLGVKYQHVPGHEHENIFSVHGRYEINDEFSLEATAGTEGGRAVFMKDNGNSIFTVGAGISDRGDFDANVAFGTDKILSWVRFGENRPLDARLIIGNPVKATTRYVSSVTDGGNNELSDIFGDVTFPFSIGSNERTKFDFYDATGEWLGQEPGSLAFDLRLRQDNDATAKVGYVFNSYFTGTAGVRLELDEFDIKNYGLTGQLEFDAGKVIGLPEKSVNLFLGGYQGLNDGDTDVAAGIFGGFNF